MSTPSSWSTIAIFSISSGETTIRSVMAKPTAKSSRSAGLAIITAWVVPLKEKAIGTSSGTNRRPEVTVPLRRTICETEERTGRVTADFPPYPDREDKERPSLRCLDIDPAARAARQVLILDLPLAWSVRRRNLHRRHLEFRTTCRPVGEIRGDDIRLRGGVVECRIDNGRRHAVGDKRAQRRLAGAAGQPHPVAFVDTAIFRVMGVDFQPVLLMPGDIAGATRLRADIVLREDTAGRQQQRETGTDLFIRRDIFGAHEVALAAHDAIDVHHRRAERCLLVAGPL